MVPLGTPAPDFALPDLTGKTIRRDDFADAPALLVVFLCNHCPYVKHVEAEFGRLVGAYPDLAVVGICTNDVQSYPDDSGFARIAFEKGVRRGSGERTRVEGFGGGNRGSREELGERSRPANTELK